MPNLILNRTFSNIYNSYSMIFGRSSSVAEIAENQQWPEKKCHSTMRQSFHRALTTCRAPLPPGKKYVAVQFLTKELIFYVVDTKSKGQEVFEEACKHLGILDAELFGLAFYQDGDYIFIDLNLKVSKYAMRSWKTHNNGIGGDGRPLLILHMRIKYYVDCHLLISEKVCRHHYYLQLRENVKSYCQAISEEKSFVLAALALQADLGNFDEEKHTDRYFEINNYFPPWIVIKIGEEFIIQNIPALHKDNAGLSRGEAQVGYIKEASDVTAPHNLHLYKMRRKKGKALNTVWLGIRDSGIHIYEQQEAQTTKILLSTFLWCDIAKLHFEKKKFEILSEGTPEYRRFTYFVQSENLAKNFFWMCRSTHHFHMANQSKVMDLKKLELEGGKTYREAYIYTDSVDQAWEKKQNSVVRSRNKYKLENCTVNFNGTSESSTGENSKPLIAKMNGLPWNNVNNLEDAKMEGQFVHHSMETLPLTSRSKFSSDIKYKSQSISCFTDRALTPCPILDDINNSSHLWDPAAVSSLSTTPTSTLMSRSSCTSNTESTCSSLSLTSGSTIKAGSEFMVKASSLSSNDRNRWVKCDSFEELPIMVPPLTEKPLQKICISTFIDKHVRTASVYDAVTTSSPPKAQPAHHLSTSMLLSSSAQPLHMKSSLEIYTSGKSIDVKRTPSLNICKTNPSMSYEPHLKNRMASPDRNPHSKCFAAQKTNRHYVANAHNPSHGRTATRIGVSSLSRDQRLPLTLFNERRITAAGSEPNLYYQIPNQYELSSCSTQHQILGRNVNSQSEMSLNAIGYNLQNCQESEPSYDYVARNRVLSLPDVCSNLLEGDTPDFPFIPPPPAYRNNSEIEVFHSPVHNVHSPSEHSAERQTLVSCSAISPPDPDHNQSEDILDIQALRQRSRDLDLPLITALCNDRSLLMLPKTVPTCSRQRHMGGKNPTLFGRAASLPNGENGEFPSNGGRPMSWHVDSFDAPHWSENSRPTSASWDNSIKGSEMLPPTILTSFSKTPERQLKTVRDYNNVSENYRSNKNQMIPSKLLASSIPNGRLYQKGLSS